MKLRSMFLLAVVLVLASAPASAQVYRWVDAHGVTNYSDDPPPGFKTAHKAVQLQDRISVYTPDRALTEAIAAFRQQINNSRGLISARQDGDRMAQQRALAAQSNPCQDYVNCQGAPGAYSPVYPYLPVVAVGVRRSRSQFAGGFSGGQTRPGSAGRGTRNR
jgi:hypothetical protein